MSCSYADGLSPYENKGKLGLQEKFDSSQEITEKTKILAEWISHSKHVVIHTGAGISTSAGIPDFRGPNGVWTLESRGRKPEMNVSFDDAIPTKTHMALVKLIQEGKVQYIVSQNIDGLHLRSGVPRTHLAELHGNMFIEQCGLCSRQFIRNSATSSVGQKSLKKPCPTSKHNGRPCRGQMHDVILDWEHNLPERDLGMADFHSCVADLSICLGTTLQIVPSGNLPLHTKKYGKEGKLVICNLQPTKHDRKADLLIHSYVDDIMSQVMNFLGIDIPEYNKDNDPTNKKELIEWTISELQVRKMRKLYEEICSKFKQRNKIVKDDKSLINNVKAKRESTLERDYDENCDNINDIKKFKLKEENNLEEIVNESIVQNNSVSDILSIKKEVKE